MAEILYKYCLDENDELICIDGINEENRHNHKYKCISCGREMITKLSGGGLRSKSSHFAHEANVSCNSETYLHNLAKIKIKEQFEKKKLMLFLRDDTSLCSEREQCKLYNKSHCLGYRHLSYNLCEFYDTCEVEATIGEYRADLLLKKADAPEVPPILIEVFLSHKCTPKKTGSGYKIIETNKIKNEKDISQIIDTGFVSDLTQKFVFGGRCYDFDEDFPAITTCKTYNIGKLTKNNNHFIRRFILGPDLQFEESQVECKERDKSVVNDSVIELNINTALYEMSSRIIRSTEELGALYLYHKFGHFSSCLLCEHLYKHLGCRDYIDSENVILTDIEIQERFEKSYHINRDYCDYFVFDKELEDVSFNYLERITEEVKMSELPSSIFKKQ